MKPQLLVLDLSDALTQFRTRIQSAPIEGSATEQVVREIWDCLYRDSFGLINTGLMHVACCYKDRGHPYFTGITTLGFGLHHELKRMKLYDPLSKRLLWDFVALVSGDRILIAPSTIRLEEIHYLRSSIQRDLLSTH